MDVVGAHVGGRQAPALLPASLPQPGKDHFAAPGIHLIRRLVHRLQLSANSLGIGFHQRAARQITSPIDGTCGMTVQMAAITHEGNQIGHAGAIGSNPTAPYGHDSA